MRKIILEVAVTLDGFIEGPNGEYDWCFDDQDYGMTEFFKRIDSIFIGRRSYELMQKIGESAVPGYSSLKEYVFSTTLKEVKTGTEIIHGDIKEKVEKIKNEPGRDIWLFGGASLTTSLLNLNLIDEMRLAVHPIILGSGKPLFIDIKNRVPLHLMDTKTYSSGLVRLTYSFNK